MIPYGRQDISDEDIAAVAGVLRSDFLTQGPAIAAFEQAVARRCEAAHAVAVCNATAALHVACLALGVGPGDLVWTSPLTFVASANCALYCGAEVDFVDVDPATWNMSPRCLAEKLAQAEREGRLPKVVIPVHLAGQPCEMVEIHALAQRYGFRIIEDASHAVGARYRGEPVGNCRYSDIAVFSFHPVKIVTTAEGGIALTQDPALAKRMALLRSHGITRDPAEMEGENQGAWYYEQLELGFNYRMTDMQAALGLSQMDRLSRFVDRRREIAARYDAAFANQPFSVQQQHPDTESSYHLYVIHLHARGPGRRKQVFDDLRSRGIGVNLHYIPVHLQPYYRRKGFGPGLCPAAEDYYEGAISVPLYPGLSAADEETVIEAVKAAVRG
jgi:UDP-4-amino-4,6-dideoxy-N-acetyl-beta-L-altrosamine transaminase